MIERIADILTVSASPAIFDSEAFWLMLLLFYPVYGILYRRRVAMMVFVTVFSLLFCYKIGGWSVLFLLLHAVAGYGLSVAITRSTSQRWRRALLVVGVVLSVGVLAWFKFSVFAVDAFSRVVGSNFSLKEMIVPVGISFYTFRTVSYLVDVYRGMVTAPRRMLDYVFYLTYFPVLVAGPIVRTSEFFQQVEGNRQITAVTLYSGLFTVMKGLLKKAVFADYLAQFNNLVFDNPQGYNGTETILALLGFSAQIYLDFSGYSDIAIGLSRTLGIELPANFRQPYKSLNLTDFWRRWHISLSSWLRDYVYIPLGGNRCGEWRMRANAVLTMTIGGIWHGAGATFLLWGLLHGMALTVQKAVGRLIPQFRFDKAVYWLLTFAFVTLMWLPFRCTSSANCLSMFAAVGNGFSITYLLAFAHERGLWLLVLVAAYVLIMLPQRFASWTESHFVGARWIVKLIIFCVLVQMILEFSAAYVAPFIYAGF